MSKHYQVGETVVSTYAFGRTLKESSAYLWLEATNSQNAVPAIVQVLNPKAVWKETEIREVIDYFDQLLRLHRSGLWVPEYLLADRNCPVALIYKPASAKPLIDAIKQSPQKELTLLSEAVAALHSLHNRDILHGGLSPECFVQTEDKVKLYGFGYAPLLRCGNSAAKHDCEEFLAPEVAGRTEISIASDLYAFAKAIGSWKPELENSVWYQKATDEDPVNRFQRARKMFDALERVLGEEETEEAPLEKFKLSSRTEPPDAGSVLGVGNYQNGGEALLEAKPISSYKFVRWEGDKRGKDNPLRFKIEGNLSVTAVFEKKGADATLVLKHAVEISCVPVDAGAVFGGGNHMHGKEISVKAVAHRLYQFQAWNGDLSGIENPLRLEVDGPMQIKAHFVKVSNSILEVNIEPGNGGVVDGSGEYPAGEQIAVSAQPKANWQFSHWSGNLVGSSNPAQLTLDTHKQITAHFVRKQKTLSATCEPPEGGGVEGSGEFRKGDSMEITATPNPGWSFVHWGGDVGMFFQSTNPLRLELRANMAIVAHFKAERSGGPTPPPAKTKPIAEMELIAKAEPAAGGKVVGGGKYASNATVPLEAKPASRWKFERWSGRITAFEEQTNPIQIKLNQTTTIIAHFIQEKADLPRSAPPAPPAETPPPSPRPESTKKAGKRQRPKNTLGDAFKQD